jgi:hypothetical protein
MKSTTFVAFLCGLGLISYVSAGPSSINSHASSTGQSAATSGGPGFSSTDNPGVIGRTASDGAGFSSQNNPGDMGSQFGQATAASASSNGSSNGSSGESNSASETGRVASANGSANGTLHQNANATIRNEKVTEVADTDELSEGTAKTQKSEVTKKFESHLLEAGLPEIPNSHANAKAVEKTAALNPIGSASAGARPSFSVPPSNPPPPVPQASVPSHVPAVPGVSPIPSASVSRGIDPVPSATVSLGH